MSTTPDSRRPILVTGAAGFIGFHIARRLLRAGHRVVGADSLNAYYDPVLKRARLAELQGLDGFRFVQIDLADREACVRLFDEVAPERVVHMAAQAGVRHSISHPTEFIDSNLTGFGNVLEGCRHQSVAHLLYASSSSVYGANTTLPYSVDQTVDRPLSLYAATKKANELMAHAYSHLYRLPTTGVRFFPVYGPWGRPDMARFLCTDALIRGRPSNRFNGGKMGRDLTYIDDAADAVVRLLDLPPQATAPEPPYTIQNVGNSERVDIARLVRVIEAATGCSAMIRDLPMQPGDVHETMADTSRLEQRIGAMSHTDIETGVRHFVEWYRDVYVRLDRRAEPAPVGS